MRSVEVGKATPFQGLPWSNSRKPPSPQVTDGGPASVKSPQPLAVPEVAHMAFQSFVVVKDGTTWRISIGTGNSYSTRREATKVAIAFAERAVRDGRNAKVLIRDPDGTEHIEWSRLASGSEKSDR